MARAAKVPRQSFDTPWALREQPISFPVSTNPAEVESQLTSDDVWDVDSDDVDFGHDFDASSYLHIPSEAVTNSFPGAVLARGQKRTRQSAFENDSSFTKQYYPDFLPRTTSPSPRDREKLVGENPFTAEDIHPALQRARNPPTTAQIIKLDGFVRGTITVEPPPEKRKAISQVPLRALQKLHNPVGQQLEAGEQAEQPQSWDCGEPVPHLPPQFGDMTKLNMLDRRLFNFYLNGVCKGRTVIESDNTYLKEIAPMISSEPGVRHAILSLASSYVLDYSPNQMLEWKAAEHHGKAVRLLNEALQSPEKRRPGQEDALIASLILLGHNECINWEVDRTKEQQPKWYRAAKLAEEILDTSNPAPHFKTPENVQFTRSRAQLANRVCLDSVLSHCVYPLDLGVGLCRYPWLILGTHEERRRIIGFTGLSSELMHYFVKITHLCSRRLKRPDSHITPNVGHEIEKKLTNFWQWSGCSVGFETSQELLNTCKLDENGKVATAAEVTDLVGESYVAAAQIYLQCRFFRRSRKHPGVQAILRRLLRTIEYQPTSGQLFTAQTPLFSVFIGGIVAYNFNDRDAICAWFNPICKGTRGNVPPTYAALKHIWKWLDDYEQEREQETTGEGVSMQDLELGKHQLSSDEINEGRDAVKLDNSDAWWEHLAEELSAVYGRINLA